MSLVSIQGEFSRRAADRDAPPHREPTLSVVQRSAAVALAVLIVGAAPGSVRAEPVDPSGDLDHIRPLLNQTLETEKSGVEIRWSNPSTEHRGLMRVERTFYRDDRPCRDYIRTVERSGRSGWIIRGTACREDRGRWEIASEAATETGAGAAARSERRPSAGSPAGRTATTTRKAPPPPPKETERAALPEPAAGPVAEPPAAETTPPAEEEAAKETERAPFVTFTRPSRTGL